jgi:FkbM family methyltransferase
MIRAFRQGLTHLRRLSNARRLGIPFTRRSAFQMPRSIRLGRQWVDVSHPDESGIAADFLTCFIDDGYGLGRVEGPVRTIADIGANVGFFSMAARAAFPVAEIHAYEPNPRILPHLAKNAEAARFRAWTEAVGATSGFISIEDTGDSNQARTTLASASAPGIPQVPLSTVVERLGGQIDLAKIDCEGAEWEMFADSAAWRRIRLVRMEYHLWGRHVFAEVRESLHRLGFEIHHHESDLEWGTVWCRNTSWEPVRGS